MKHCRISSLAGDGASLRPHRASYGALVAALGALGLGTSGCGGSPSVDASEAEQMDSDDDADDDVSVVPRVPDAGPGTGPEDLISEPEPEPEFCGDANLGDDESCDDGNTNPGDGCSDDCALEDGFTCPVVGARCELAKICGDARQIGDEQCDDGNTEDLDGCSGTCRIEADHACPTPGELCVSTVVCGDGRVSGGETCDDGNVEDGDGCDGACAVEPGFACESPGARCTPICGDGNVDGHESCDDGNVDDGDGCSESCQREQGFACAVPGMPCHQTTCGDGTAEGDEPCDDGDDIHVGDGCSPGCKLEPSCEPARRVEPVNVGDAGIGPVDAGVVTEGQIISGTCSSTCGDGLILAGDDEECDDGNNVAGDGCDADCKIERGWACALESDVLPDELSVPVVYRDFIHDVPEDGSSTRHPDFQVYSGSGATLGLTDTLLGADGKPVYTGICEAGQPLDEALCPHEEQTTSEADFRQWYTDTEGVNIAVLDYLTFDRQADDTYVFGGGGGLFPLDERGWVATDPPEEALSDGHNYGFTTELRYWFEFKGGEFLEFEGDDDVWVYIGGQLVVDIGGLHPSRTGSVTLDDATAADLGLQVGRVYEMALFHAERHTSQSNFKLTIGGFLSATTRCETECGDGIVAGSELCDDGENNGAGYGFCQTDCSPGPRCGDGEVNGDEVCDNGVNLSGYQSASEENPCAPGCVLPSYCGDGRLDGAFGEQCDDGEENTGEYGGCNADCTIGPRCGDGIVNGEELCDDGNASNRDSCDVSCKPLKHAAR